MNKHLLILWVLVSLSLQAFSQNQANIWMFGLNAGIDFNSNPPTAIDNSALVSTEGSAVMCNPGGQLLFYTNGVNVWDRNNTLMPRGSGLLGSSSTTQSSVIVPRPDHKNNYYIFTLAEQGGSNGLTYSEVDMSLNSGNGDIALNNTTLTKNIPLQPFLTEKLTAIRHSNGVDYWVLVHGNNDTKFYAFNITSSGPSTTAVVSDIGSLHPNFSASGYMKFSPNGKKVACAVGNTGSFIELFDFNDETGELTNPMRIDFNSSKPYGIEFSPNSKYLYVSAGNTIFQYAIPKISNSTLLAISEKTIHADADVWGLQLASNNKIYVCKPNNKIGVINKPNNDASTANFIDNSFSLNGRSAIQGLPNFMTHLFADNFIVSENTCAKQATEFKVALNQLDSVHWEFAFANGTLVATKTGISTKYTFVNPGKYNIKATIYSGNYSQILTNVIQVEALPNFTLGSDTTLCKGQSVKFDFSLPNATYKWNNGKTGSKYIITTPGIHFVDVSQEGCTVRDSISVTYDLIQASFTVNNSIQCFDNNAFEFTSTTVGAANAVWYIGTDNKGNGKQLTHTFTNTGSYKISHAVISPLGCADSISKDVNVAESPKASFTITTINNCSSNNRFIIKNTTNYADDYTFEVAADGRIYRNISPLEISFPTPGEYKLKCSIKTKEGCTDFIEKTVKVFAAPNATFYAKTNSSCLSDNNFDIIFERELKSYEKLDWKIDGVAFVPPSTKFNHSFKTTGKHTIFAELSNTSGCKVSYSQEVEVFENPEASFTTNTSNLNCLGTTAPIQFSNQSKSNLPITDFVWDFGDNTEATTENPNHKYSLQAQYIVSLTVTNDKGCKGYSRNTISTFEQPEVLIDIKTLNACEGKNSYQLGYTNVNNAASIAELTWTSNSGINIPSQSPALVSFPSTGTHKISLKATTDFGCSTEETASINVFPNPTGTITANSDEQCLNKNKFELSTSTQHNGIANTSYVWGFDGGNGTANQNQATVSFAVADNFTVNVEVTDENGCTNTFSKELTTNPNPVFDILKVNGCANTPIKLKVRVKDSFLPVVQWDWDFGDGNYSNNAQPMHSYTEEGNYNLSATATSDKGCLYTASLAHGAQIAPIPNVSFESEKTHWGFDETTLKFTASSSITIDKWQWTFGNGQSGVNKTENVKFKEAGYYTVSLLGTSNQGCVGSTKKSVLIVPPFDAYVPTSFTPNGDGINDFFGMEGVEFINTYSMKVFNRWGQELFSTSSLKVMWDGRYNNNVLPGDMYTYVIHVTDIDNRPYKLSGTVQLIR